MRQFAKEKLHHWLRVLLHTKDSPERTSFAFAFGVFISFLPPVPWFHTIFALLLAFIFRLNRVAVLVGTYVNTPLTLVPLFILEMTVAVRLVGGGESPVRTLKQFCTARQFSTAQGWKDLFEVLTPYFGPLMVVCVVLGAIAAVCAYFVCLRVLLVYRHRVAAAATAAAAAATAVVAHAAEAAAEAAAKAAARAKADVEADVHASHPHKQSGRAPGVPEEGPTQRNRASPVPSSAAPADPSETSS